jgi:hypothetical protein
MARAKQASKRKRRGGALAALGATGLSFSLGSGASAGPAVNMPPPNTGVSHEITFAEEEIADVSLATFYVFDKENTGALPPGGLQLVRGGGCGCGGGCRGCGGGRGCGGCGFRGCAGFGGCYGCVGYGYGCVGYGYGGYGYGGYGYGGYGYGGCCISLGGCRYC